MTKRKNTTQPKPPEKRFTLAILMAALWNEVWLGAADTAAEQDVNLVLLPGGILGDPNNFLAQGNILYDLVTREQIDGLIVWSGALNWFVSQSEIEEFCQRYQPLPMVSIEAPITGIPGIFRSDFQGMREAINHLIEVHGYRTIAFIQGPEGHIGAAERYRAYTETLAEHDIPLDMQLVTPNAPNWDETSASGFVSLLLDERKVQPEAIVAPNDVLAVGVMAALQARGIQVPQEIAVTGFDDLLTSSAMIPPLTSVHPPFYEMGRQAVLTVLAQLQGQDVTEEVTLPLTLMVRQSCGCPDAVMVQAANGYDTPKVGQSLAAVCSELPQQIMSQAGDIPGMTSENVGQLCDAFVTDLKLGRLENFIPTLSSMLQQISMVQPRLMDWQDAISILRHYTLPSIKDRAMLAHAEDLWQQARVVIGQAAQQSQAYHTLQHHQKLQRVQALSQALISTFNLTELVKILTKELPALGITSGYMALYANKETPLAGADLVLAYNAQKQFVQQGDTDKLPAKHLLPAQVNQSGRYSLIALPLYFQEQQLGFALLHFGPRDATIYEALRDQISSALHSALLVQQSAVRERNLAKQAAELETVAQVSTAAATILDTDKLLKAVADVTKDRFYLYHAHVYVLDSANRTLHLAAGAGETGDTMVSQGWSIPLSRPDSLVAQTARDKQGYIINDVRAEANFLPNPLLPDTRSELAVPIMIGDQVLGVFDVQADRPDYFTPEDLRIQSTLAGQIAVALQNARLFEDARQSSRELEETSTFLESIIENLPAMLFIKEAETLEFVRWNKAGLDLTGYKLEDLIGKSDYDFFPKEEAEFFIAKDRETLTSGEIVEIMEEPIQTLHQGQRWLHTWKVPVLDPDGKPKYLLGISEDITERKQFEFALAKRATELEAVAQVSTAASTILDVDELLQQVANLTKERFGLYHAHIYLFNGNRLILAAGSGPIGEQMVAENWGIAIVRQQSLVARAARTRKGVMINDVHQASDWLPNPLLPDTRSELAIPMIVGEEVLGVLDVQSDEINHFSDEDLRIQSVLASQVAVSLQNTRLYTEAQRRAKQEQLLREITTQVRGATDPEAVVRTGLRALGSALGRPTFVVLGNASQLQGKPDNGQPESREGETL